MTKGLDSGSSDASRHDPGVVEVEAFWMNGRFAAGPSHMSQSTVDAGALSGTFAMLPIQS
jgi:hypothetical protein